MMTESERQLLLDLELLDARWTNEWAEHVKHDTQPTREDERRHLLELKKIITDRWLRAYKDSSELVHELIKDLD